MSLAHWARGLVVGLVVAVAGGATAADLQVVTVVNRTGLTASDLHVTFSGTGGSVFVAPASVIAPPCPMPAVPSNGQVTNTVDIDWGVPCVDPGGSVTFWVYTPNGPLGLVSARWTRNGVDIGPARDPFMRAGGGGGGGGGPFWGVTIESRCIGGPWAIKGPWGWNGSCWVRSVCWPEIRYETRLMLCRYVNRRGRIVNTGVCFPITDWEYSWTRKERYFSEFASIRPPNLGGEIIPVQGGVRNGPPIRRAGMNNRAAWNFGAVKSDNSGEDWTTTADFRSTFVNIATDLGPMTETPPAFSSPQQMLAYYAPSFASASLRFEELRAEVLAVDSVEPAPEWPVAVGDLSTLRDQFAIIAAQFGSFILPSDPLVFDNCRQAIQNLSSLMPSLMPARAAHVQEELQRMADGFGEARDMVALGLTNQAQSDNFLYAVLVRLGPAFESAGLAMGPHVRISLGEMSLGWYPHVIQSGALVRVKNVANGDILDTRVMRVSEGGAIYVPIDTFDPSVTSLEIRCKFDSFLSHSVTLPHVDGFVALMPPTIPGDVDGDDVISPTDAFKVLTELGMGGQPAPDVPSSDVDANGIVDSHDLSVVNANMGQVGAGLRLVAGRVALPDFDGPPQRYRGSFEVRSPSDLVLERHDVQIWNDQYSLYTDRPAGEQLKVVLKVTGWLADAEFVTLGSAREPFDYPDGPLTESSGGIWRRWSEPSGDSQVLAGRASIDLDTDVIREFGNLGQRDEEVIHWSFDIDVQSTNTGNEYYVAFSPASAPYQTNQNYAESFAIIVDRGIGSGGNANVHAWPIGGTSIFLIGTIPPGTPSTISGTFVKRGSSMHYSAQVGNGPALTGTFAHTDPRGLNAVEFYQGQPAGFDGNARIDNLHFAPGGLTATSLDFAPIAGDIDGDNEVGIGDFAVLSFAFGSSAGDPNYIEEADLNGDETIDIGDYAILSQNFGRVGD